MQDNTMMTSASVRTAPAAPTTAILVINSRSGPVLCPFFGKCDGVLLVDRKGRSAELHYRDRSDGKPLCDLILELKPDRLVCGFISEAEKQKLRNAGIDVRLGSCSCSIDELFADFHTLPQA